MELQLQNANQHRIADLLWNAQNQKQVNIILRLFGHDAQVVYHMMIAATFDEVDSVVDAEDILERIKNG